MWNVLCILLFSLALAFGSSTPPVDKEQVECAVCTLAINEILGLVNENVTDIDIQKKLDSYCTQIPSSEGKTACKGMVELVPYLITQLDKVARVEKICKDLNLCTAPPDFGGKDFSVPLHFVFDLDLPPRQRWQKIYATPIIKETVQYIYAVAKYAFGDDAIKGLTLLGDRALAVMKEEYAEEVRGAADVVGLPEGLLGLIQMAYTISDGCTSIVGQTNDGTMLHARNLDFALGMAFTAELKNMTMQLDVQRGGKTVYKAVTYGGYIGVLTGVRENGVSVSVNTRMNKKGVTGILDGVVEFLEHNTNATLVPYLVRDVLDSSQLNFEESLNELANHWIPSYVYLTVAGPQPGNGAVISRTPTGARDIWRVNAAKGQWFVLETNYDHWQKAPALDNRRQAGFNAMYHMGRDNLSLQNMAHDVLSVKPVLNQLTTYTSLMNPKTGYLETYHRYCSAPCPA